MKILVVGLGNPFKSWTPHNIGADLLQKAFTFSGNYHTIDNIFFWTEPDYMNISGIAIKKFVKKNFIDNLIVLVDDIDTPIGKIVVSFGTSHRGHNGIRSIIDNYGKNFWKIRIGVGREGNPSDFVLSKIDNPSLFLNCIPLVKLEVLKIIEKINK